VRRRTPLPQAERGLALADRFLLDPLTYQQRPAELALAGLRPRILIADVVGLGKTLEIGLVLVELIRRGRGERILVVTPQHVLGQLQHELWTRFSIPLVRLDSTGISRIQQEIPAGRNPFTYFKRAAISVDTLNDEGQFGHHLDAIHWDAVVINESHNLINRGTQRNTLARKLAERSDALLLASATPHNGDRASFAELIRLLDPAAIADRHSYEPAEIEQLYRRRTKINAEVRPFCLGSSIRYKTWLGDLISCCSVVVCGAASSYASSKRSSRWPMSFTSAGPRSGWASRPLMSARRFGTSSGGWAASCSSGRAGGSS
jgi:hypothetical protein